MTTALLSLLLAFTQPMPAFAAGPLPAGFAAVRALAAMNLNCVNPGGGCDGSLPCCGQNNYCIDRVCRPYPAAVDASAPVSTACTAPAFAK